MTYYEEVKQIKKSMENLYINSKPKKRYNNVDGRIIPCSKYKEMFESLGYQVAKPYHANGIGNNNEYKITKRIALNDGFEAEAIIGSFNYNYDLYCKHIFVSFYDKDNNLIYKDSENIYYE